MKAEYVNSFIKAFGGIYEGMTQTKLDMGKPFLKTDTGALKCSDVLIIIGLTGDLRGQVVVSMDLDFAKFTAGKMMGLDVMELGEMGKSAISEMGNMIMGHAATYLSNQGILIDITPPTILVGKDLNMTNSKMKTICIPFEYQNTMGLRMDISVMSE